MFDISIIKKLIPEKGKNDLSREEIAQILQTVPGALEEFEKAYEKNSLADTGNLFEESRKSAKKDIPYDIQGIDKDKLSNLINRIVAELLSETRVFSYTNHRTDVYNFAHMEIPDPVSKEEIYSLPKNLRPQLTGNLVQRDIKEPAYIALLSMYQKYKEGETAKERELSYHMFRQGLDILDLDPITYDILSMNPNSMGYWFPALVEAVEGQDFFKLPATKILKVPLPILQLTRLEYASLTKTTMRIVDDYCMKAFRLDPFQQYFVKTGTYSSKFNFRNAYVHGEKEVQELGEYLLFIQNQACVAAGPLSRPSIYGMSTTNEWVVREYITDPEGNPCIYQGLPLRTEYRLFVDFDTDEVLGIAPYWEPTMMKERFGHREDADSPHNIHDYEIFLMHEKVLMSRYKKSRNTVVEHMKKMLPQVNLEGQWSVDIMQNGKDFYIIDMALAVNSALKECISKGRLRPVQENWLPVI